MLSRTDSELTTQLQQENAALKNKLSELESKIDAVSKENALLKSSLSDIDDRLKTMRFESDAQFKMMRKECWLLAMKFAAYRLKNQFETQLRNDQISDRFEERTTSRFGYGSKEPLYKVLGAIEKMQVNDALDWHSFVTLQSNYVKYKSPDDRGYVFEEEAQLLNEILSIERLRNPELMHHRLIEFGKSLAKAEGSSTFHEDRSKKLQALETATFFASKSHSVESKKQPLPEPSKVGASEVKTIPQIQFRTVTVHRNPAVG